MKEEILKFLQIDHHFPIMVSRILLATILSGIIGMEREIKNQPAGLRTHMLVAIGSCSMMLLSIFGFEQFTEDSQKTIDLSRIPAYVISGIGFLGAGTIIVHQKNVRGLTTAASIWVCAGLGLLVGIGMHGIAIITTLVVVFSLYVLKRFEDKIGD